jgi:ABC-type sugar transport system ATPase subunit
MNLVPVEAMAEDGALNLRAHGVIARGLPMGQAIAEAMAGGRELTLGVRPEHLAVGRMSDANTISGKLFANENMGPESLITLERNDASRVTARLFVDDHVDVGDMVTFSFEARHASLFDAEGRRIALEREVAGS